MSRSKKTRPPKRASGKSATTTRTGPSSGVRRLSRGLMSVIAAPLRSPPVARGAAAHHTAALQKILVIDDEPSMRELLGIMLRKEGFEVLLADSRASAATMLARGPVSMVITDVKLPDGDGIEILRHVKAAAPETVVIVMTAFGSTQTAVAARSEEHTSELQSHSDLVCRPLLDK